MIFFQIQAAYNLAYLEELIGFIYSPTNFYLIFIDKSRAAAAASLVDRLRHVDNIAFRLDSYVTWGGVSQVNAMLAGMMRMRQTGRSHRFYVNISDSDIPLWTLEQLTSFLEQAETRNKRAFIAHWQPEVGFAELGLSDDTGLAFVRHRPDIAFSVDARVAHYFDGRRQSPIVDAALRPLFMCYEQSVDKTIHIRPLAVFELAQRKTLFGRHPIYFGRQWMALHSSIIDELFADPHFFMIYQTCATTFIPDEMFFQTALLNIVEDKNTIVGDNLRFRGGAPSTITDDDFPELEEAAGAAFARKFERTFGERLLARARAMFAPEIERFAGAASPRQSKPATDAACEQSHANLAIHKPATQSSISAWSHGRTCEEDAAGANDGRISGEAGFHTSTEPNPWWQVDLLEDCVITAVTMGSSRVDLQACKLEYSIVSPK